MTIDFLDPTSRLGFLSPNHMGDPFTCKHQSWKSLQHFYQSQKALDKKDRERIRLAATPESAHQLGQTVHRVANWSKHKARVLEEGYWHKIAQNATYVKTLTKTKGTEFHAKLDNMFWGKGTQGNGENILELIVRRIQARLIQYEREQTYFQLIADQLAWRVSANAAIKKLANNSAIIGAYAEATIRAFVRSTVSPLRVSTGGVTSIQLAVEPKAVPQIDTIIWHATPLPAVFEAGEFALVDVNRCLGILEIKRSLYSGAAASMKVLLDQESALTCWLDDWGLNEGTAFGVVCLKEKGQTDSLMDALVQEGRAAVLLEEVKGKFTANADGMYRLVNFLGHLRRRAKYSDGTNSIVIPDRNSTDGSVYREPLFRG